MMNILICLNTVDFFDLIIFRCYTYIQLLSVLVYCLNLAWLYSLRFFTCACNVCLVDE